MPRTAARAVFGSYAVSAAVGVAVVMLALDRGSFGVVERNSAAIVVWWAIALVVVLKLWRIAPLPPATIAAGLALAALTALSFASAAWAPAAETVLREGGRNALYVGTFALVAIGANGRDAARWCDGIAAGIVAVLTLALASRLLPGVVEPSEPLRELLGRAADRLSYPLGYWNALGVLGALAMPGLLRLSLAARSTARRALALGVLPLVMSALYLTSSRSAIAAVCVGVVAFFALSAPRWPVAWRIAVAAAGSTAAIAVLLLHPVVVDGPFGTDGAQSTGARVALLLVAVCALTAVAAARLERVGARRLTGKRADRILVICAAATVVVGVVAANPLARFESFREPPAFSERDPSYVRSHLLSTSGNARWQYWTVAFDEFEAHPLAGGGAGSFASWWEERRPVFVISRDAHSLYFETLGELGLAGLALLLVFVACAILAGTRRALAASGRARSTSAAATASFAAFAVAAGFEWTWEIPVLGAVGVAFAALATTDRTPLHVDRRPRSYRLVQVGAVTVAAAVAVAAAIPVFAESQLQRSRTAAARGDRATALEAADAARRIEPWSASAYTQLALLYEEQNELARARDAIERALQRDRRNWTLWVIAMRIQARLGQSDAARASLDRARRLNPLSAQSIGL